jgi:hypothetical protein
MLPSLLITAAITAPGAPIPKDTIPGPTGPTPRILAVKANGTGSIWIFATIYEKRKIQQQFFVMENGKQVMKQQEQEIIASSSVQKCLGDFGGKFTTAEGAVLTTEQVARRVKDGATILVTADGKPIDPSWLQAVSGDTIVMVTSELSHAHFQHGHSSLPTTAAPSLVMLGSDDRGALRLPVNPNAGSIDQGYDEDFGGFQNGLRFAGRAGAARMMVVNGRVVAIDADGAATAGLKTAGPDGKKALEDIRLDAYDLTGKLIPKSEAIKRLKAGGLVLFAGDNRFPDTEYLKAFHKDLIVLVSPELIFPPGTPNPYDTQTKKPEASAAQPAAPAVPIAPLAPAVNVKIAPVAIQGQAVPVAPPAREAAGDKEKPVKKPAKP